MEVKQCKKCGQLKLITEFHKAGTQNGVQRYRSACAGCSIDSETAERWTLRAQGLKRCAKCSQVLSLDSFYDDKRKADGKRGICKPCHIAVTGEYRQSEDGHKLFIAAKRRYNHTPANMQKRAEYMRLQRDRAVWADRESARHAVSKAVANGVMPSACKAKCADCGAQAKEYHHESYEADRRLDVIPLCMDCHKRRHYAR